MSGECEKCGNHTLECTCKPNCARPQNGWISINDELPPWTKAFLFYIKESVDTLQIFSGIRIPISADTQSQLFCVKEPMSGIVFNESLITHWMSLPEPPKDE